MWIPPQTTRPLFLTRRSASGTSAPRGAVLIAGTGTIAAWIADGEVTHRIDGHGWLVGDDGSGFWLGRQAVRAVLAELDGRGEPTLLRAGDWAEVTARSADYRTPPWGDTDQDWFLNAAVALGGSQAVDQSIQIIERRVNELGTVEPVIQRQGAKGFQGLTGAWPGD